MNNKNIKHGTGADLAHLKDGEVMALSLGTPERASISHNKPIQISSCIGKNAEQQKIQKKISTSTLDFLNRAIHPKKTNSSAEIGWDSQRRVILVLDENSEKNAEKTYEWLLLLRDKFFEKNAIEIDENGNRILTELIIWASELSENFGEIDFNLLENTEENFEDILIHIFLVKSGCVKHSPSSVLDAGKRKFIEEMIEHWDKYFHDKSVIFSLE